MTPSPDQPEYRAGKSALEVQRAYGIGEAVKLSSNELPWGPSPAVAAAILRTISGDDGLNRYPDIRSAALREAIARYHGLEPDWVAVGAGSGGLLAQLTRSLLRPGDEVLVPSPTFDLYRILSAWTGAQSRIVASPTTTTSGDILAGEIGPDTRLVFLASPNNPTGTVIGVDQLARVADAAPPDCVVVVDEAYADFVEAHHVVQGEQLVRRFANIVVLRTFSKAHGLAGLRLGYLLGHPDVVAQLDARSVPFHVNSVAQAAGIAAIQETTETRRRVAELMVERQRMASAIRALGLGLASSQANFLWLPAGRESAMLAEAFERSGVVPRLFDDRGVRLTIGRPVENDRALVVLSDPDLAQRLSASWVLPTGSRAASVELLAERVVSTGRSGRVDAGLGRAAYADAAALDGHAPHPLVETWTADQFSDALATVLLDSADSARLTSLEKIAEDLLTHDPKETLCK